MCWHCWEKTYFGHSWDLRVNMETVTSRWLFSSWSWCLSQRYRNLLYKHQWNTRWAFARNPDILRKRSLLLWLRNKSHLSQCLLVKYLHSNRNLVSPRGHVIPSIFSLPTPITCHSCSYIWQQDPVVEYRTNETFWQKFANSNICLFKLYKRKLFFVDFLHLSQGMYKFQVLVANLKSTAVFSGKVDISKFYCIHFVSLVMISKVFFK